MKESCLLSGAGRGLVSKGFVLESGLWGFQAINAGWGCRFQFRFVVRTWLLPRVFAIVK